MVSVAPEVRVLCRLIGNEAVRPLGLDERETSQRRILGLRSFVSLAKSISARRWQFYVDTDESFVVAD